MWKFDDEVAAATTKEAYASVGLFGGATAIAIVPDASKSFGEDVNKESSNELKGAERYDGGLLGLAGGVFESNSSLLIVAEEPLGMKGGSVDVTGKIAYGGFSRASML